MPIVVIGFSLGLVIYWRLERCFSKWALGYSSAAYFGAIILKYVIQIPTIHTMESASNNSPWVLGLYYGIQTGVLEVGGAFLLAQIAYSRGHFKARDAGAFGLGLAFWENAILIGAFTLIDYASYYTILSNPASSAAQLLYPALLKASPGLFYGSSAAIPVIGYGILERVSSFLAHFSWGLLAVLGAVFRKRIYFAVAFPIGFLIDFLIPFSSRLGIGLFELIIFCIALVGFIAALVITRSVRGKMSAETAPAIEVDSSNPSVHSLFYTNFKRAVNYGKIYLIIAVTVSILINVELLYVSRLGTQGVGSTISVIHSLPALILPIFPVMGSYGALMIFVSDKDKGVYEYLIAYGVNPSRIFWSIVVATIGLVSIVLGISISADVGIALASGALTPTYLKLLPLYVIPISYAVAIFMSMAGMIWSALAVRRTGINSPVGVISLIGIAPIIVILPIAILIGPTYLILFVGLVSLALYVVVGFMIRVSNTKMVRERFLSNA
jgi:YhfC intramembrane metalloprotease